MAFYPPPLHDLNWRVDDRVDLRPPRPKGESLPRKRRRGR
jgi:hypothetical protein